jgi:murein DD-endopeptidase MepM/ murein hydrolase activator NlpD
VASSPGAGGPRFAGRIVDPDVRDDGETDPEVELNPSAGRPRTPEAAPIEADTLPAKEGEANATEPLAEAPEATAPEAAAAAPEPETAALEPETASRPSGRGLEVRERLLAKARAAEAARSETSSLDRELDAVGREATPQAAEPLDDLLMAPPSHRAPSAPLVAATPRELSPTLVAVFSTLVGIATIASITALFMSLEQRLDGTSARAVSTPAAVAKVEPKIPDDPKARPKRARTKLPSPWRLGDARGDGRYRYIEGKVGTDSVLKALEGAGVPEAQGYRVLAAMRGVVDLDKHKKSDRFQALLERGSNKLFALEYLAGNDEIYQAKEVDGRLSGTRLDLKVERAQVVAAMSYDGANFDRSADLYGFDPGLAKVAARALDGQMALEELERGDVLRLVVQEVTVLGEFSRYAGVEAVELIHADPKKPPLRLYYFDAPGARGYYDKDGRAAFEGGWRKPIKDAPRTSPFNPHRMHPVLHKVMPHQGTDFGSPVGTPVGAASFGTVSFVGPAGAAGNLVKVSHPGGVETGYAHLSRFAAGLNVGDKVKPMQIIGYVGSTGRSTGPHLHFSASRDGVFFDAETLNLDGMRTLTTEELAAFKPLVAKYDPMLDGIPMPERFAPLPAPSEPAADAAAGNAAPGVATPGAATPSVALAPGDAGDEDDAEPAGSGVPVPGTAPNAVPVAQPAVAVSPTDATAVPAPDAAKKPGGSSVYLSDKELLDSQGATDDGEVEE